MPVSYIPRLGSASLNKLPSTVVKAIVTALVFALIIGCEKTPERIGLRGGTSHLPLLHNRVLRYDQQQGGEVTPYVVKLDYSGGHQQKVYSVRDEKDLLTRERFFSRDSLVYFTTENPLTTLEPRQQMTDYRELWVDESAQRGDSWRNEETGTQTVFAGLEPLEVPAGKFANCYKTVTEALPELFDSLTIWRARGDITLDDYVRESTNARVVVVRWFAPGVGLVREQIGNELIRVLAEIEKEGTGAEDTTLTQRVEMNP